VATESLIKGKIASHPENTPVFQLCASQMLEIRGCVLMNCVSVKTVMVLWIVTASNLIEGYESFKETYWYCFWL